MISKLKPLIFISFLLLASCSSCSSNPPPPPAPVPSGGPVQADASVPDAAPDASKEVKVSGMGWELKLPSSGWEVNEQCKDNLGCVSIMMNETLKNAVIVLNRSFTGSSEEFTLNIIREAKNHGATVLATKQVVLNGHNFVLVEAAKDDVLLLDWFTLQNGRCLELTCGGLDVEGSQRTLCNSIASTFTLK